MTLPLRFYNLNFNPNAPVPNGPFYSAPSSFLQGPYSPLIIGSGLVIDPATSTISATGGGGGGGEGGVSSLTAGVGIQLSPSPITTTGTISLAATGVVAGTYSNPTITIDSLGRVTFITGNSSPSSSVVSPITNSGTAGAPVIGIQTATVGQLGAVQVGPNIDVTGGVISVGSSTTTTTGIVRLNNTLTSTSILEALAAAQGKSLQDQINALNTAGGLTLAGTFNGDDGVLLTVTAGGTAAGFAVGSDLPSPAIGNVDFFVIVTTPGYYFPPGSMVGYNVVQGDWFISDGTTWQYLSVGPTLPTATTGTKGIVELATTAETQTGTDSTRAVTPAGAAATYIPLSALTGKGVIIGASGACVVSTLPAGTDGQVLVACTAATSGLCWSSTAAAIPCSAITAKGALLTGTAASTVVALPVGTNGQVLVADSACAKGIKWATQAATPVATPTVSGTMCGSTSTSNTALGANVGIGVSANVYIGTYAAGSVSVSGTSNNVAIGAVAGRCLTTGSSNTIVGKGAGFSLTTGNCNTLLGVGAGGPNNGPGSGNIMIGVNAGCFSNGAQNCSIYIGNNAGCTAPANTCDLIIGHNSYVSGGGGGAASLILGNGIVSSASRCVIVGLGGCRCATYDLQTGVGWTFVSDARLKGEVTALPVSGEAFINNLRPVTYCFLDQTTKQPLDTKHCNAGFIAQEVEQALEASNLTEITSLVTKPQSEDDHYTLADAGFTPFVIKAIQELSAKIAELEAKLAD